MAKQPMCCAALLILSSAMTLFGQVVFSAGTFSKLRLEHHEQNRGHQRRPNGHFQRISTAGRGQPDNFRETDMTFSGLIIGSQLNSQFTHTPSTQGRISSISISYDLLETNPPSVGAAVGYAALLYQNGTYYVPNSAINDQVVNGLA